MSKETFYITTPIYYVNDKPHIGHAYTTILADILAQYHRLLNTPTHFLTGTDEHGQKVQQAAEKNKITPQQQCDQTVIRFQELWKKLNITNDDFIRTTEERHKKVVKKILQELYDKNEIYSSEYEGWYCVPCERFFTEKDLKENKCPECNREVEKLVERNYFFRMSKYQDWLIQYINDNPNFIQPEHRRKETLGFLKQPLTDLCISRPKNRLNWGIELPFDSQYVTYVWFDALVNYISAIGYPFDMPKFTKNWPATYHLIGKDILTTHTVYWPTMLKAIGLQMPKTIFAHGWWLIGNDKMSKSLGNVVNPMEMAEKYGVDAFKYFLMAEMTLGQDASFTETNFIKRYNSDLANDLGNMTSRVLTMINRNLEGTIPAIPTNGDDETELIKKTLQAVEDMQQSIKKMKIDKGLASILAAVREGNRYFDKTAPWKLAKQKDKTDLQRVLYNTAECLRIIAGLLYPIMPEKMLQLRKALGINQQKLIPNIQTLSQWGKLIPNSKINPIKSLFPRIDTKQLQTTNQTNQNIALIDFETFTKLQLKTAKIIKAEPIPDANKLLKLQLQVGKQTQQIVAGIAKFYTPEQLINKTIIIVANLKPATIRGVESNGMLLAAKKGKKKLKLLTIDGNEEFPSGANVG